MPHMRENLLPVGIIRRRKVTRQDTCTTTKFAVLWGRTWTRASTHPIIATTWYFSQVTGASASCFGERYRDVLSQTLDENNSTQTCTDCCTAVVCKQFSYSTGVCMSYIQCTRYTSVYVVCSYYVDSNSVLVVGDSNATSSAVSSTRRGAHENTYGMRNRR